MPRDASRTPDGGRRAERFEREARALRVNLRRRKEQARLQAESPSKPEPRKDSGKDAGA